jgi:hypothetical protein
MRASDWESMQHHKRLVMENPEIPGRTKKTEKRCPYFSA